MSWWERSGYKPDKASFCCSGYYNTPNGTPQGTNAAKHSGTGQLFNLGDGMVVEDLPKS